MAVETEYAPAAAVENDAIARLGKTPLRSADPIEQAVAVRVPNALRRGQADLAERIAASDFEYCVFSGDPASPERWPETGWLVCGVDCPMHRTRDGVATPRRRKHVDTRMRRASRDLGRRGRRKFVDIERNLGRILNQRAGEQTTRMAMTTIANALTFHATVVGVHGIPPVAQLRDDPRHTLQSALLETWRRILREVNYLPIFAVASSLLAPIRAATCRAECSRT